MSRVLIVASVDIHLPIHSIDALKTINRVRVKSNLIYAMDVHTHRKVSFTSFAYFSLLSLSVSQSRSLYYILIIMQPTQIFFFFLPTFFFFRSIPTCNSTRFIYFIFFSSTYFFISYLKFHSLYRFLFFTLRIFFLMCVPNSFCRVGCCCCFFNKTCTSKQNSIKYKPW